MSGLNFSGGAIHLHYEQFFYRDCTVYRLKIA